MTPKTIDLEEIMKKESPILFRQPEEVEPWTSAVKRIAIEAIHQALVLASENAQAYLDYDCETEQGDPSAIVDKESILHIEKLIK